MEVEIVKVSRTPVKTLVDTEHTICGQPLFFESTGDAARDRTILRCLDKVAETQFWGGK